MALIQDILLGSNGAIDFPAIPGTYKALFLTFSLRSAYAGGVVDFARINVNSDVTGAHYSTEQMFNNSGTVSGGNAAAQPASFNDPSSTATASIVATGELWIPNYAGTTFFKGINYKAGYSDNANAEQQVEGHTTWLSTAAITDITVYTANAAQWLAGSRATLYGLV